MTKKPNIHAKALSKMGASKGGKARASVLTPEQRKEIASKAIRTRWARAKGIPLEEEQVSTSPEQTSSEIVESKPSSKLPVSLFQGTLEIGDVSFSCHVLDSGERVIVQREVVRALTGVVHGNLPRYLTTTRLSKYFDLERITRQIIDFAIPGTQYVATGYDATLVVDICDAYLKAREDGILTKRYNNLAKRAEIIMRSCAKVGIIALIDEATGYQKVREENALRLKLQTFISEEMQEWARMFPEEFFVQLARLESVHYSPRNRPLRWGRYVMAFVYDAVDKDVGRELRIKNPNPHFKQNLHQWLKEYGREKVRDHLHEVLGVMKTCHDMDDFKRKFGYVFKKSPLQLTFFDLVDTLSYRS
jgi:hypothetical protein